MRRAISAALALAIAASAAVPARALDASACGGNADGSVVDAKAYGGVLGSYMCNVYAYCQSQVFPAGADGTPKNPRSDWMSKSGDWLYAKFEPNRYPEVKGAKEIAFLFPAYSPWKKPSDPREEYRATQDKIYNCALWNLKSTSHKLVLGLVANSDDKFKKYLENLEKKVQSKMLASSCRSGTAVSPDAKAGSSAGALVSAAYAANLKVSERLVGQSAMEYCTYRYYLEYLAARFDDPSLFAGVVSGGGSGAPATLLPSYSTGSVPVVSMRAAALSGVAAERSRLSRSYLAAVSSFGEFSRGYSAHLILRLLERDYASARAEMDKMLTPVSQALYKAVNAMGTENTK